MNVMTALRAVAGTLANDTWEVAHANAGDRGWEVKRGIEQIAADMTEARARYIAAMCPASILELLDQLARVTAERDSFRAVLEGAEYGDIDGIATNTPEGSRYLGAQVGTMTKAMGAELGLLKAAISSPERVFVNMKTGAIAKPTIRSMVDLYGEVVNGDDAQLLEIARLRGEVEQLRKLNMPGHLELSAEMRAAGDREVKRARDDGCASVRVLEAVFFQAAMQCWLNAREEAIDSMQTANKEATQ